jgi:hypothetical protein
VLATAILGILIARHAPGIDGPAYAHYGWHRAPWGLILPPLLVAACIFAAALFVRARVRAVWPSLLLLMACTAALMFTNVLHQGNGRSLRPLVGSVESPMIESYFADAAALCNGPGTVRDWLAGYPQLLPQMYLHSQTKGPGPVLLFVPFIRIFGETDRAALAAAIALALLIPLAVPATYALARALGIGRDGAFFAAAAVSLFPSLVLFYPLLDGLWVSVTAVLLALWARALRGNSTAAAAGAGAVLFALTLCVYNVLVIGALMVAYGFALPPRGRRVGRFLRAAVVAVLIFVALYGLLFVTTGFDPVATFQAAHANQARLLPTFDRPYPRTILFDLTDFALGVGWIALVPAVLAVARPRGDDDVSSASRGDDGGGAAASDRGEATGPGDGGATGPDRAAASGPDGGRIGRPHDGRAAGPGRLVLLLGLLELLVVAATGLLPGETARVWAFLTPLVAVPAGAELARWRPAARVVFFACALVLLALLIQNLGQTYGTTAPLVGQPAR